MNDSEPGPGERKTGDETGEGRVWNRQEKADSRGSENGMNNKAFGWAWLTFAVAVAVHVTDEATHNFLPVYNASVSAIRARLPLLPLPTFRFGVWLTLLILGIVLLLSLTPLAFRGKRWLRIIAVPLAIVVGVFNASLHIGSSVYFQKWMPGVYSSPLLLAAAVFLLGAVLPGKALHRIAGCEAEAKKYA
jgi:Protein of unknown function with HXXEE motif